MKNHTLFHPFLSFNVRAYLPPATCLLPVLLILFAVQISGWQWSPEKVDSSLSLLSYWVSQSMPVIGIIFIALTVYLLRLRLRLNFRQNVLLLMCIAAVLLSGAGVKRVFKDSWQEPRPYVVWLQKQPELAANLPVKGFYELSDKSAFVSGLNLSGTSVPEWQQSYWAKNTGYSFPSGHSLFALQLMLMMLTLLWREKAHMLIVLAVCWTTVVLGSRLVLGMHWPVDLLASGVLAFVLNIPFVLFWGKQRLSLVK